MRAEHLYVHVPFCARRCVYCDFSIAVRSVVPEADYLDALRREIAMRSAAADYDLATLYLGGGTPSKLSPHGVGAVLELVRSAVRVRPDAEITIEANPEDVNASSVAAWQDAGVNRVSLGVQSFQPRVLSWMRRTHTAEQAGRAVDFLRSGGIENVSIDLIFAVPADLNRFWQEDLERVLALRLPHLSVYGLTIESHTPLGRWVARNAVAEAGEESFEAEFLRGSAMLGNAGYHHYEVSNYALPGRESRHNSAYWSRVPYGGFGPSAHEFDGTRRRWNVAPYAEWVDRLAGGRDPIDGTEALGEDQVRAEEVYLGLRTSRGLELAEPEKEHVQPWIAAGWAEWTGPRRVRLTAPGWLRLDTLSAALTHVRSRY